MNQRRPLGEKMHRLAGLLRACLHRFQGEEAYQRYLFHLASDHPGETPVSRAEFYRQEQERKWSGINRCC